MSSVVIAGNTSGSVTLSAPDVAGTTTLTLPSTSGTVVTTNTMPAGSVLQVLSTTKTNSFSTSSTSFTDVTGLSVSITPSSTSNKILVFISCTMAGSQDDRVLPLQLVRGSTAIGLSDQSGSSKIRTSGGAMTAQNVSDAYDETHNVSFQYLDSPSTTSSTTYKIQTRAGTSGSVIIGLNGGSTDDANRASYPATITVMEVKG